MSKQLAAGTRVRLRAPSHVLDWPPDARRTGVVVGPAEWRDYYIIQLDEPAIYRAGDGLHKDITLRVERVRELVDNLDVLD